MIKVSKCVIDSGDRGPSIVSAGTLFLTQSRLADLPANPVNQLVKAEKKNLKEIVVISRTGIIAGAAIAGVSGLTVAWIVIRGR